MPLSIHERLNHLQAELLQSADPVPLKLAKLIGEVLDLIEQNRNDLTNAFEAQVRTDQRLHALEKTAPGYEARG